ncbi:hypothetical protein [Bordetella genomosp. 5]|uniref:hypothetical protein n=1 Tax=Bordetella genomosp. 5 TaxID=1395608 RepID=UPI00114085AC|nr:hypothetical protein [Bordetella genomosp. 5]
MRRQRYLHPLSVPLGIVAALLVVVAVWAVSLPFARLQINSGAQLLLHWAGCLAALAFVYAMRFQLGVWAHGAVAVAMWSRLYADLDLLRASDLAPRGAAVYADYLGAWNLTPLFLMAAATSLTFVALVALALSMYRRVGQGAVS